MLTVAGLATVGGIVRAEPGAGYVGHHGMMEWGGWLMGPIMMVIFFIVHIYFATTGHTATSHIKAMITGYEEVEDEAA